MPGIIGADKWVIPGTPSILLPFIKMTVENKDYSRPLDLSQESLSY